MSDGKIDGTSIAEQVIAGLAIVVVTATAVHAYDTHKKRTKPKKRKR